MKLKYLFAVLAVPVLLGAGPLFAAPVISSFTPTFGASNDPSYIIISGSGFSPGTLVVRFNGVRDTGASANTMDSIQAHVPVGATNGSNPIFVSVNGVVTYSAQDFTVIGSGPYVTDFSPTNGSAGTAVTINGVHFTAPLTVKFNGVTAPGASAPTPTQISVNAPAGVTTGPISVTTTFGTHTNPSNFFVPPVVTGFSPAAGRPGTNVVITGTNFLGAIAVRFNETLDATSFIVLSNRAIQAVVPIAATTGRIRIITPAGSVYTSSNFVVQPTLTGFTPGFGAMGTNVTITGANFNSGTPVVKFNGVQAAPPSGVTFSQLTAVVPAGATTGPITVTNTSGAVTSAINFFVSAVITSFTPSNSAPGTLVAIKGTNFTGASAVTFAGTPAAGFHVTNNTSLGAFVPAGVTSGLISVTTPAGTVNSSNKFYGAPVISSFNPTHGLPGTNVVISGQNFLDASSVRFNGSNATFAVINNTNINATVPANAQPGPITVIAPAGTNTSAQSFTLDFTANLSLSVSDSPDPVVVGNNLLYSITIANGGPYVAPGVTFTNTLPGTVNLIAATTTQGALNTNANPVTGNLGQLGVGANLTITLTVAPQATGPITNFATFASQYPDPTPANNSATNVTFVQPLPILGVKALPPNLVRLSWPTSLSNYTLEFKSVITNTVWSPILTLPVIVGSESQVTETNNQSPRYYRLRRLP